MNEFKDKVVFVTGAASGIGFAIAQSFGRRGARLMLADIDDQALDTATRSLESQGINVRSVHCDVADAGSVAAAAQETLTQFGKVHVVVNNAGVSLGGMTGSIALEDWRWIVDINLLGVANGVEIFLPLILAHGEGGHIVNTASMAGHWGSPGMGPYNATKFAVVGYSETMRQELAEQGVGVSVLCPAWVRTKIAQAAERRPSLRGVASPVDGEVSEQQQFVQAAIDTGLEPDLVGEWVADCVLANRLYIFTHPDFYDAIEARAAALKADYDACIADPRFANANRIA